MGSQLLRYFSEWFANNQRILAKCNATVELSATSQQTGKPSIYADISVDGGEILGRITLWATGECDLEGICSSTSNWVLWENHVFDSEVELDAVLQRYFTELRKRPEE